MSLEVTVFVLFNKVSTMPYLVIVEGSDFKGTFGNLLISKQKEVLSRWVDSGICLHIFIHVVDISGHVVFIIVRQTVSYFVQFAFDIGYVKVET